MKSITIATLAAAALLAMNAVHANDFEGAYVTLSGGLDHAKASGNYQADKKNVGASGAELGYRWNVGHDILLGANGFFDYEGRSAHDTATGGRARYGSNVYGTDFTAGSVIDSNWYVYSKLGVAHVKGIEETKGFGKNAFHYGAGVAYQVAPHWTVGGEYTAVNGKDNGTWMNNGNAMLTVSYEFGKVFH